LIIAITGKERSRRTQKARVRAYRPGAVERIVPIARLNRNTLRKLAESRLEEARILLDNRQWTGAYYLTGLAIECALKSCLASEVKQHDFPDKQFVNAMYVYNLENLFKLNAALWVGLQTEMQANPRLTVNWSTIKDWDDGKRYSVVEELESKALFEAATEAASGLMVWLRGRW
jgi:HEPN domain-containing protein